MGSVAIARRNETAMKEQKQVCTTRVDEEVAGAYDKISVTIICYIGFVVLAHRLLPFS